MKKRLFILLCVSSLSLTGSAATAGGESSESDLATSQESPMLSASQQVRAFSIEHVNLVRVAGESITDVVYDVDALEVEPDKTRGIVFVRAKPAWAASGKKQTAAYFNTAARSYGLMLEAQSIPSQTIEIAGIPAAKPGTDLPQAPSKEAMAPFPADSYTMQLKHYVLRAFRDEASAQPELGTAFSPKDMTFVALKFEPRVKSCNGFRLEQRRAYATREHLIELLTIRNLMFRNQKIPFGQFARELPGTLAIASDRTELPAAAAAESVLISRRSLREDASGMHLATELLCPQFLDSGAP